MFCVKQALFCFFTQLFEAESQHSSWMTTRVSLNHSFHYRWEAQHPGHGPSQKSWSNCLGKAWPNPVLVVEKNIVSEVEKSVSGLLSEAKSLCTVAVEGLGLGGVAGRGTKGAREHLISRGARAKPRCLLRTRIRPRVKVVWMIIIWSSIRSI